MDHRDIAIIGGDRRIAYMAPILLSEGCRVISFGVANLQGEITPSPHDALKATSLKEALSGAGTVVCGIPLEKNGFLHCEGDLRIPLSELQRGLRKKQKFFAGILSEDFRDHCAQRSIECYDFMKDEPLTLFNAICTAEGAILEALSHKECLLCQSRCLVLGYGRCGSMIADRLRALCASVSVTSVQPAELTKAQAAGCQVFPLSELARHVPQYDYVFNTIPACYLGENCLPKMRRDCLIIDVASGRSGLDYDLAKEYSLKALFCPGLPGKYAAKSCAERLVRYVLENIEESKTWKGV